MDPFWLAVLGFVVVAVIIGVAYWSKNTGTSNVNEYEGGGFGEEDEREPMD